ncbi:MAG TPA: hypothetical protein VMM15_07435 [Bradyrhizobium sp.]|nr:hypothetical protein [Bradyrhizobium sp.]
MKWIEERDALIAQSKAFVEAVTRRSADRNRSAATSVQAAAVAPSSAPPSPAASVTRSSLPPSPAAPVTRTSAPPPLVAPVTKAGETISPLPTLAPLERKFDQVSMTSEIRSRIAAFRAHQERFNRERHEYFNATLARLRAEINELPEPVRRQADSARNGRRADLMPDPSRMPAASGPPHRRPEGRT